MEEDKKYCDCKNGCDPLDEDWGLYCKKTGKRIGLKELGCDRELNPDNYPADINDTKL